MNFDDVLAQEEYLFEEATDEGQTVPLDSNGSVSRLRELESSLPIGYTLIDTDTLRKASDLIALEFGRSSPIARRIDAVIKDGLPI